jgi:hypothetical protein
VRTEDLVTHLAEDAGPAPGVATMLRRGLAAGTAVSLITMLLLFGLRPDMASAIATPMFWMKLGYALALGLVAAPLVVALARPTGHVTRLAWLFLAPIAVLALMAMYRLANAPPDTRTSLFMGGSASVCTVRIVLLSLPILAGAFYALRRSAPIHLESTGAIAGILAGATGAFIYALHCTENAAPFVVVWYTLGMAAMGAIGAALGRFTLRW